MNGAWRRGLVVAAATTGLALSGCATLRPKVAATNLCEDLKVSIYFEQDSAKLTRDAKQVLNEAAVIRKGCAAGVVDIVGLADAVGDPQANQALSVKRAKAVTQALGSMGYGVVNVAAAGESGSTTAAGELRPLRRRADLTFKSQGK
jgi:peptidoglycan-associated lipoprotein